MSLLQEILNLSGTGFTNRHYYESMNQVLKRLDNVYTMLHHFLNRERYDEEILKSDLVINHREDISNQVRKGRSIYRNWFPEINRKLFFQYVPFRIFYIINAGLNICFLHNKQHYFIYVESKPVPEISEYN
jgi:hypothetical protein